MIASGYSPRYRITHKLKAPEERRTSRADMRFTNSKRDLAQSYLIGIVTKLFMRDQNVRPHDAAASRRIAEGMPRRHAILGKNMARQKDLRLSFFAPPFFFALNTSWPLTSSDRSLKPLAITPPLLRGESQKACRAVLDCDCDRSRHMSPPRQLLLS